MTFAVKTRGAGGPMIAEYICPAHERFEMLVNRDEQGNPPARIRCMVFLDDVGHEACDEWCDLAISAPRVLKDSVPCRAAVRGGDMKERPPGMLDTRPLAEGMPMAEWKQLQKKHSEDRRHKQLIERGLKTKKVQV